jgi:hypothetical protein
MSHPWGTLGNAGEQLRLGATAARSQAIAVTDELVQFVPQADGTLLAVRQARRYRFLLDDGRTVDVVCDRADSVISEAVRKWAGGDVSIAGVADLTAAAAAESPPKARKRSGPTT